MMTLLKAKVANSEINAFYSEAMSGDYNHVIRTCMTWVDVN